ncbi:gfo/Idh/MocA family oxidoreductase [Roseobacter denitrificans]|uniref:Oxidoreductase, putative n=1 Tax=Roseobacter denitrificans (strain ATCC 33942 / OCh 114) TaxID=375451 RepID=Q16DJ2_ROSDO|nr:Gfo/Idh/MocA family oxidoreductase [Roseobacter denitrificans]ABG29951.1 oxidoreductase, putative [Roseobacter denitrificans OCh 114]AVL53162.1 gfo/Idh/MocA family oxidoreductase [Roseobacter denitrificans]SFG38788.1 Predicted dehydrogenase [Roseobacter denitrificans OCh 114]
MAEIGIGIIGGGYMGKAHAVAFSAVGAVFDTTLRPRLEMVAASTESSAASYAKSYGFARSTGDWRVLVADADVQAIVIASPPETHLEITRAAAALGKPVFCEKPLGRSVEDGKEMVQAVEAARAVNMIGFNYIRTPASQYARALIAEGEIGDITWFRGEHTEDFYADPDAPATWRAQGDSNGCMGDLAPHMINAALALIGPIGSVMAEIETVHKTRGGAPVTNDDQGQIMCRFTNGAMGHLFFSRTATGRKMGYIYEVTGTRGAIRFDQEDQNALWLYKAEGPEAQRGFRKILTGPAHPDYEPFCQGPGHGTGYQDQIIIEARDFLAAIEAGKSRWPTFRDGLEVSNIVEAARRSHAARAWQDVNHG